MSFQEIEEFLLRHRKVGIDSSIFIFEVEAHPKYLPLVHRVFRWLEAQEGMAVTSTITLLELLVQPYRLGDINKVNQFFSLLVTYPNLQWIQPTLEIADLGARLRAEKNLRTPDAIQAATALIAQATGFLSNDPVFKRVGGMQVLLLDELLN